MAHEFKVGDTVTVFGAYANYPTKVTTIIKISPKRGDITLNGHNNKFNSYGSQLGSDSWHRESLHPHKEEHSKEITRRHYLEGLKRVNMEILNDEELAEVSKIVQVAYERWKAKKNAK